MGQNSTHCSGSSARSLFIKRHLHIFSPSFIPTAGKISLPSALLQFWDLGGQRGIRSIWSKYYGDCHAVVFVIDAVDHERLSEGWEVFGTFPPTLLPSPSRATNQRLINCNFRRTTRHRPLRPADPRRPAPPASEQTGPPRIAFRRGDPARVRGVVPAQDRKRAAETGQRDG